MITSLTMMGISSWFRRSLYAQIAAGAIALLGVWKINNFYQQSVGRKQVVQASKQAGIKRNVATQKIRSNIQPSTAMQRLRQQYADGN